MYIINCYIITLPFTSLCFEDNLKTKAKCSYTQKQNKHETNPNMNHSSPTTVMVEGINEQDASVLENENHHATVFGMIQYLDASKKDDSSSYVIALTNSVLVESGKFLDV